MLSWEPLQPKSCLHQVLRAVCDGREFWLYPPPSGQGQRWRLLEFDGNTYLGASEHPSQQNAQRAAECLQSVDRTT